MPRKVYDLGDLRASIGFPFWGIKLKARQASYLKAARGFLTVYPSSLNNTPSKESERTYILRYDNTITVQGYPLSLVIGTK